MADVSCPTLEQLEQYTTGKLAGPDRNSVETHVASCADCGRLLADVESNVRLGDKLGSPPEDQMPHETESPPAGSTADAPTLDAQQLLRSSPAQPRFAVEGYEILRELSRGGQGVVYQAVQKSTKRKLAIKVLKEGHFADAGERARFEREIQILGQLKHTNIVTIYDSGSVKGNAFFVMDYISGKSLDTYVADKELSIDETLKLFQTVCDAVHSAHLRGVIHRDLKPSNIRVDADGQPHVLDFGLAKVAGAPVESETPVMTMTGQFLGSLPWSSPEQAEGVPSKIDIRTDVYSLGVILYHMLTGGKFPHEVVGNMRDVLGRIMQAEPAPPSTIRRQINDEVETIVLKCLSKERERRYQSAGELARDIQRYQAGEPIEAKRDSGWYLLRKALQRYRMQTTFAAALAVLIFGFAISMSFMYRQASAAYSAEEEQRRQAELKTAEAESERTAAQAARDEAQQEADKARAVTDFLQNTLASPDPAVRGIDVRVIDAMRLASSQVADSFVDQPLVEAELRNTIGLVYLSLDLNEDAEIQFSAALDMRRQHLRENHPDILTSLNNLAALRKEQRRPEKAEALYKQILDLIELDADVDHYFRLGVQANLASVLAELGRLPEALKLYREALEACRRLFGDSEKYTISAVRNLAICLYRQTKFTEAEPLLREALASGTQKVPDLTRIDMLKTLAAVVWVRGSLAETESLYRASLGGSRRLRGPDHRNTLTTALLLGRILCEMGRLEEAEHLLSESVKMLQDGPSADPVSLIIARSALSDVLIERGRLEEAERCLSQAPTPQPDWGATAQLAGLMLRESLSALHQAQGELSDSREVAEQVLATRERILPANHPHIIRAHYRLASVLLALDRLAEAESHFRAAAKGASAMLARGHWLSAAIAAGLGECLIGQSRFSEAEAALTPAFNALHDAVGPDHRLARHAVRLLVRLYELNGRPDQAEAWRARLPS